MFRRIRRALLRIVPLRPRLHRRKAGFSVSGSGPRRCLAHHGIARPAPVTVRNRGLGCWAGPSPRLVGRVRPG
jgi:hypothetical protein